MTDYNTFLPSGYEKLKKSQYILYVAPASCLFLWEWVIWFLISHKCLIKMIIEPTELTDYNNYQLNMLVLLLSDIYLQRKTHNAVYTQFEGNWREQAPFHPQAVGGIKTVH